MTELRCDDGTVVQISKETEKELRKVFGKPEHKWVHGDVFSNHVYPSQMYVELLDGPMIVNLEQIGQGGTPGCQLRPNAEPKFLFNIKDALSDRGIA